MPKAKKQDICVISTAPENAKVRVGTVAELFGVSIPTIWRRARAGLLPAPHKIAGTTVWNAGDIRRALENNGGC